MSQLARNTLMLTAASIGQKLIAFLYFALIARTIGDEATGSYFIALAMVTTIGVLDDVGLTAVTIREVAKTPEKAKELVRNVIGIKLITMPITIVLALLLPDWRGFDAETTMLVQLAIAVMLLDTLSISMFGVLRGLHKLKYESIGIFVGQTLTACVGTIIVGRAALTGGTVDLRWLVIALIVGSAWNMFFATYQVVKRLGVDTLKPSYSQAAPMLRMSFMFFLAAVFVKVYSYIDSFTIEEFLGKGSVGIYAVAYKFTYAFQFLPLAFVGALYPTMSSLANNPVELNKTLMKAEWYLALLAAPIVFGIFSLAPEIIDTVYGPNYAAAAPVLEVLIFVLLLIFLDFPVGSLLNATGRQAVKTGIMGGAMIINIVANLLLVPMYGIMGAAIAALFTFIFLFGAGWMAATRIAQASLLELIKTTGGFFVAGIVMAVVVIFLKQYVYWIFTVPVGALVFIGLSFATKTLTISHLKEARNLIRRPAYAKDSPANH
jgi:O-antigen/teichoic acid export membrane protein